MKDRITSELESHRTVPLTKIKAFTIIQRMPNFINEIWPVVLMFNPPKNKQTKNLEIITTACLELVDIA